MSLVREEQEEGGDEEATTGQRKHAGEEKGKLPWTRGQENVVQIAAWLQLREAQMEHSKQ